MFDSRKANGELADFKEKLDISKSEFISKLINLNIAKWHRDYVDLTVFDGTQWELTIYFSGGKRKNTRAQTIFQMSLMTFACFSISHFITSNKS